MYNETEELKSQIEEILLRVDALNNAEAAMFCGNEIIRRANQKAGDNCAINKSCVNDYSSFIPAY